MRFLLLSILALPLPAQVTALFQPFPLRATERLFANGRAAGIWQVRITNEDGVERRVSRERLFSMVPHVVVFNPDAGLDLLGKRAAGKGWAITGRIARLVLDLAPAALGAYGGVSGVSGFTWGATGLAVVRYVVVRSDEAKTDPSRYAAQFCPAEIEVAPHAGATCYFAAALLPDVRPQGPLEIHFPPIATAPQTMEFSPTVRASLGLW